jgi:hypothetical protein
MAVVLEAAMVKRARQLLCLQFKRLVGVTPRQFRMSARIA